MEDIVVQRKLEETVAAITAYADSLGVHLQLQCDAPSPVVHADRKRLRQVLNNLLSNAIKFSPKGGTVAVRCEQHDGLVRITVRDQGPGVPKAFEPRLFEQFSRADSADTRQIGGTGLGLAISKELIERMHGHIGYHPVQPTGACFFIELPQQTATESKTS
ncbi:ATP-binding protein [Permianibacter sp. IMCC34836]|nr:ATP-binding protein [Permianibacter fluminis]